MAFSIGDQVGNFIVRGVLPGPGKTRYEVACRICGGYAIKQASNLSRDLTCSKRCHARQRAREHIGERYGRLVIVDVTDERQQRAIRYLCLCDSGETITVCLSELKNGNTRSCGCLQRERASETSTRHGLRSDPRYDVRRAMISRCYDPLDPAYQHYGGRGITVCERWRESVEAYVADIEATLGPRPSLRHSLDRLDNNGNYDIDNLRWATQRDQLRNTSRNLLVTIDGIDRLLIDWLRQYGVQPMTYYGRVRRGWSLADAITRPVRTQTRSGGLRGSHRSMMRRCHGRLGDPARKNYGDRGIKVYEAWRGYATFERHMIAMFGDNLAARIARDNLDIDRIDADGDYEPENVRWVTRTENARLHRGRVPSSTRPPTPTLVTPHVQEKTCHHCGATIPDGRRAHGRGRNVRVRYCSRQCNNAAANLRHQPRKGASKSLQGL